MRGLQQILNLVHFVTESCRIFLILIYSNISVLFQILVTLYMKITKYQEILGNQDSTNLRWLLSESIEIQDLVHHFFTLRTSHCDIGAI